MKAVKTERILQGMILALLCVFVYVIFISLHEKIVAVGDSAPEFTVTADNGQQISTSNFGGKLLVLNFWATWCPPCIEEIPSLNEFQRRFAGSGVVVLGVSVDKDEKAYRTFLDKAGLSFLTARDPQHKISAEYGTFLYPETYLIDAKGKVVQKIISNADWNDERLVSYVKSLL
jgi:cytochrome c biogenesis protein CcmG, thiol:disulfide interchange protein DsbE